MTRQCITLLVTRVMMTPSFLEVMNGRRWTIHLPQFGHEGDVTVVGRWALWADPGAVDTCVETHAHLLSTSEGKVEANYQRVTACHLMSGSCS